MTVLLILLIVGVIAAKTGVIDEESNRRITRFALVFPQSAMVLNAILGQDLDVPPMQLLIIFGASCGMYAILILLGVITPILYRVKKQDRGTYSFLVIFGNTAFMGYPVVSAIFGSEGLFYAAIFTILFNLLAYSVGIKLISSGNSEEKLDWRKLVNAPVVTTLVAIVLLLLGVKFPDPVDDAIERLGNTIVPLSMIIIGASLGSQKAKEVFGNWRTYLFAPVRLLVAPIVVWAVMRLFITNTVLLGTVTILAAMPCATMATLLSIRYGGNERVTSQTVFVTTVLAVVTVPLLCWLLPL